MSQPSAHSRSSDPSHSRASAFFEQLLRMRLESAAPWFLIMVVAWSPFPVGSDRQWSWSLLLLMIAAAWLVWLASVWNQQQSVLQQARPLYVPLGLGTVALAWGVIQVLPIVPASWAHPVWSIASGGLGRALPATISLDPWRTEGELAKLAGYAMTAWLFYSLSRDNARARFLFSAVVLVGVFYVAYSWVFAVMGWSQFQLFYSARDIGNRIAAPFVNRDSLATYSGVITLCCGALLFERAAAQLVRGRGALRAFFSLIQFAFGRGTPIVLAMLAAFSLEVATGSLGGTLSMLAGIFAMLVLALGGWLRSRIDLATGLTGAALAISLAALLVLNGGEIGNRLGEIASTGLAEQLRLDLWSAAQHMIKDAPLLGLGLGTYENAYPMYAQTLYPFVMDKAHNDFLELAAGWGLPAAIVWCGAIGWLVAMCVRGVFVRRRGRILPLVAVGATVLVGVHALVEFSLQIPAIALLYAALLGLGVAQSFASRERAERLKI